MPGTHTTDESIEHIALGTTAQNRRRGVTAVALLVQATHWHLAHAPHAPSGTRTLTTAENPAGS